MKAFLERRDYKNTWKQRLKDCVVALVILHSLACLLLPPIRDWTLSIIVRCNEEYFTQWFYERAKESGLIFPGSEMKESRLVEITQVITDSGYMIV